MLSKVSGFPVGKYSRIVTPSWLKAGFIKAVSSIMGRHHLRVNSTAFFPTACTA